MKTKATLFIFLLTTLFVFINSSVAFCQQQGIGLQVPNSSPTTLPLHLSSYNSLSLYPPTPKDLNKTNAPFVQQDALRDFMTNSNQKTTPDLYKKEHLAFFCRLEVKMENAAKIPVKFRLGDVQYVDYLEGKRESWQY